MKLNNKILKDLIKEILQESNQVAKMGTQDVTQHTTDQRKAMRKGGIDDKERAAIAAVSEKLAKAAQAGNILSGNLKIRLEKLMADIDKALGGA